ncbi:MAG: amino acid permease [Spirochaetales bacterium]|nr:amino acid permease [Spirochaetales bacterium]
MGKKFGTFRGVFVPSTEAILGTVLFLLLPLLTADLGFLPMLLIILLSHTVTLSTAFSLADCATNLNRIEGGGMYALSKRSLGKAMGGSIGIPLYLAQAASVGFYCIGFAEPLHPIVAPFLDFIPLFQQTGPEALLMQKQLLASAFLVLFFLVVMAGADFTLKIQSAILVVLILSVCSIFFSPFLGLEFGGKPLFTGEVSLMSARPLTMGIFFLSFTQFFPAVTGISTGIGMSGDLESPRKSIVQGTFLAIGITMAVYVVVTLIFSGMDRSILIEGYEDNIPYGVLLTDLLGLNRSFPSNLPGLLILLGVLFATSSSALSVFMTGPRTVQFLARDNILPGFLDFLEKDFVKDGEEPRYAVVVTFFFGLAVIWMGSINLAATVVGILFLIVYGWVNLTAFLERFSRNPSFRPTFKGHWAISLYGFLACFATICLFNWQVGLLTCLSQYLMFRLILRFKSEGKLEGVWWGVLFTLITGSLKRIRSIVQGSLNWRPVLLTISYGTEKAWWREMDEVVRSISSYQGLVSTNILLSPKKFEVSPPAEDLRGNTSLINTANPTEAVLALIQASEMSGLESNTVFLEYSEKVDSVKILNGAMEKNKNLLLYKGYDTTVDSRLVKSKAKRLDIWWRGERNGNFMALLAYIINAGIKEKESRYTIRILRMVGSGEDHRKAEVELNELFAKARINGEVKTLPYSGEPFHDILSAHSSDASLIMMGIPGNYVENNRSRFRFSEFFFSKEIGRYNQLPPILFIRSVKAISLTED